MQRTLVLVTLLSILAGVQLAAGFPLQETGQTAAVNINTATVEELQALPGIGPSIARRIVEYRQEHGEFEQVEDLLLVRGIGEKKFLQLKERVTVE